MMAFEDTSIQVKKTTRDKLLALGRKGETYDYIINKLLEKNDTLQ